jgi:hypothetical protein
MNNKGQKSGMVRWAARLACMAPLTLATIAPAQIAQPARGGPQGARGSAQQQQDYTQDELKAAIEFMQLHAKNRLAALEGMNGPRNYARTRQLIVNQKRNFDRIKANNANAPEIYESRLREYEINDEIFGICKGIKKPADASAAAPELQAKVAELLDVGIKEQHARIDRLEKALAAQKANLEATEKKRDALISSKAAEIAKNGVEGARLNFNRGAADTANPGEDITASPADKTPAKKK